MFDGRCEQAMSFYVSVFPDAVIASICRYGPEGPAAEGSAMQASLALNVQTFTCVDSPAKHESGSRPAAIPCPDKGAWLTSG